MKRKYFTEEERKQAQREYHKQYYQTNKEKIAAQQAEYYQNNKEKKIAYRAKYYQTPMGRAFGLLSRYKSSDKKYNRDECTITAEWIVEHIFNQPCHYCGRTGWTKMGCDRVDNSLPHTPENCVPCCDKCNRKRGTTTYEEFMKLVGKVKGDN